MAGCPQRTMVGQTMTIRFAGPVAAVCVGLMFVICAGNVNAEVYVTVDRTTLQPTESLTLV